MRRNIDADNLSRGRTSDFPDSTRILFDLHDIFNQEPFPKYINNMVQWDPAIHPLVKTLSCVCLPPFFFGFSFFSPFPLFLRPQHLHQGSMRPIKLLQSLLTHQSTSTPDDPHLDPGYFSPTAMTKMLPQLR